MAVSSRSKTPAIAQDGKLLKKSGKIEPMLISVLEDNPWQPRTKIDPHALEDLKKSIEDFGFIGYIPVRRGDRKDPSSPLEIVYGHRRVMAARMLGHQTVPVMLCEVSDEGMMRLAYVENATHKKMTYWEEALHFQDMQEQLGLSVRQLAEMLGTSRNYIFNRLSLLKLPEGSPMRQAAERGDIAMSNAQVFISLAKALTNEELATLLTDVRAGTLTLNDLLGLQNALDRALAADVELDDEGRRVQTATLLDQARAKELRPRKIMPEVGRPTRAEREMAAAQERRDATEPTGPGTIASAAAAKTLESAVAHPPISGSGSTRAASTTAANSTQSDTDAATSTVGASRDGGYYAREMIEQLEGVLTHLRQRAEKSDLALLPPEERARFDRLRSELITVLNRV
jgi:ParB/RepB/Spo0J family partition protein